MTKTERGKNLPPIEDMSGSRVIIERGAFDIEVANFAGGVRVMRVSIRTTRTEYFGSWKRKRRFSKKANSGWIDDASTLAGLANGEPYTRDTVVLSGIRHHADVRTMSGAISTP